MYPHLVLPKLYLLLIVSDSEQNTMHLTATYFRLYRHSQEWEWQFYIRRPSQTITLLSLYSPCCAAASSLDWLDSSTACKWAIVMWNLVSLLTRGLMLFIVSDSRNSWISMIFYFYFYFYFFLLFTERVRNKSSAKFQLILTLLLELNWTGTLPIFKDPGQVVLQAA